ncbi:MAG: hypothetical protein QOI76_3239 [Frankiales bacterium]|nr:hypothetical protein [Frankiales bacterium]
MSTSTAGRHGTLATVFGATLVFAAMPASAAGAKPPLPVLVIHPQVVPSSQDYGVIRPSMISFTADVHGVITGIKWASWTKSGAVGHGKQVVTDCVPNCAQSTLHYLPATITLGRVQHGIFTRLVERVGGRSHIYSGASLLLVGAKASKHYAVPRSTSAPCTVAALSAAARLGTPDFYAFDRSAYGCAGKYAYAGVTVSSGGQKNEITEVFKAKKGHWVRASRLLCDQGVIPPSIRVPACQSN